MGKRAAPWTLPATTVLLFVIAGFVAADVRLGSMATHMDTRGLQSTTLDVCDTEWQACVADATCIECNTTSGCEVQFLDETTCDDLDQTVCCTLENNEGCADNEAYTAYGDCFFGAAGCSFDIGECDVETGEAASGSGSTGGVPAYGLAVAFVAAVVVSAWGIV
ncbi:unnamed protein product [Scytosiphon promiscuus]